MADDSRSSPAWLVRVMPSAADLIFIGILAALLFTPLAVRLLGDAGIGWHIRTGQQILATHSIPRADLFSSTMAGRPWFAWEWLYDALIGELEARLGLNGVVWFTAVVIALVFALLFRLLIRRGSNIFVALVLTLLALSASTIHFLARPHVLTWLFTLGWFVILDSSEHNPKLNRRIWWLPLLMLLWVNVHGAFLMGFILLAIFLASSLWDRWRTNENRLEDSLARIAAGQRIRILVQVSVVSALASLVNPYGWKLHAHIYSYLSDPFLMSHVEEFQSPNFHGIAEKCFAVLMLITVAVTAARGRRFTSSEFFTSLFAIYAGLYASRNIPISSLLLASVMGPALVTSAVGNQRENLLQRMTKMEAASRGHAWCILAAVMALAACFVRGKDRPFVDAHFDATRMPVAAVDYVQAHDVHGPIFSPDYWGGYMIYRLFPRDRVVLDDRHDLYGDAFLKSYLEALHGGSDWQQFIKEHPAGCVLVPNNVALSSLLRERRDWTVLYSDSSATLFVRTEADHKH